VRRRENFVLETNMTIKINDFVSTGEGSKYLSIDLIDILNCIEKNGEGYKWKLVYLEDYVLKEGPDPAFAEYLHELMEKVNTEISFSELLHVAKNVVQIIDCEINGISSSDKLTISAVDSSFWEIITENEKIISCVTNTFKEIEISK